MTEQKEEDPKIKLMIELVMSLAKEEIKEAMKKGTLPIDVGMDELFFKGVCFGIALATEKMTEARKILKTQEQVKKN